MDNKKKLADNGPAKVSRSSSRSTSSKNGKARQVIKDSSRVSTSTGTQTKKYASVSDGKKQKEIMARKTTSSNGASSYEIYNNKKLKSYEDTAAGEKKYKRVSKKVDKVK